MGIGWCGYNGWGERREHSTVDCWRGSGATGREDDCQDEDSHDQSLHCFSLRDTDFFYLLQFGRAMRLKDECNSALLLYTIVILKAIPRVSDIII